MVYAINGTGTMAQISAKLAQSLGYSVYVCSTTNKNQGLSKLLQTTKVDGVIDFSHPNALNELEECIIKYQIPCVFATTGYNDKQLEQIKNLGNVAPICQTYNTSLGVAILEKLIQKMNEYLTPTTNIEIIEAHHNQKIDAPSGSAIKMYNALDIDDKQQLFNKVGVGKVKPTQVGFSSLRLSNVVGQHEIKFGFENEIISIEHLALSKEVFAKGAIQILTKLQNKTNASYDVSELLGVL